MWFRTANKPHERTGEAEMTQNKRESGEGVGTVLTPSNEPRRGICVDRLRMYAVLDQGSPVFCGTLARCYEAYPTTACVGLGKRTARGLAVVEVGQG